MIQRKATVASQSRHFVSVDKGAATDDRVEQCGGFLREYWVGVEHVLEHLLTRLQSDSAYLPLNVHTEQGGFVG